MLGNFFNKQPEVPIGEKSTTEQQNQIPFYQTGEELGKQMLRTDDYIERFTMELQGYVYDGKTNNWKQTGDVLCNEKGANAFVTKLGDYVHQVTFLGKIDDQNRVRIQRAFMKQTAGEIIKNIRTYELGYDSSKWLKIYLVLSDQCYFALSRAVNGTEKGFFGDVYQMKTVMAQNNQQQFQKKGFLG